MSSAQDWMSRNRTATAERPAVEAELLPEPPQMTALAPYSHGGKLAEIGYLAQLAMGKHRDDKKMLMAARRVGERMGSDGLYSFPAGGGRVEGITVGMAEALAYEWGHLWWGTEIVREEGRRVTIKGLVVDALKGNMVVREGVFALAPAPGKFAEKQDQADRWGTMQLQVAVSKHIRTVLLHAMPAWFTGAAEKAAREAMRKNDLGGVHLDEAREKAVDAYRNQFGVTEAQLEDHMGSHPALWTGSDVSELKRLYRQLLDGERTVAAVFGPVAVEQAAPDPAPPKKSGMGAVKSAAAKKNGAPDADLFDGGVNLADADDAELDRLLGIAIDKDDKAMVRAIEAQRERRKGKE